MKRKVLSLMLAAAMALSLTPAVALAAEDDCDPIIIGGSRGERPATDPYKDHIDTLAEAAEKGYVLTFSEDIDDTIDLGSVEYGSESLPSKTITMTNEGDKSLYLVSTGYFQTKVGIETDEYKEQYNTNFSNVPVYELEPGKSYSLHLTANGAKEAGTHKCSASLDFSYTYPANHSALKAWDLTCNLSLTYTVTFDGEVGGGVPFTASPEKLDFKAVENGTSQSQTLTLTNTSRWEVELRGSAGRSLTVDGKDSFDEVTLAPGESLTLTVTASPEDVWPTSTDAKLYLFYDYWVEETRFRHQDTVEFPVHVQSTNDGAILTFFQINPAVGPSGYYTTMDGATTYYGDETFEVPAGETLSFKAVPYNPDNGYVLAVERSYQGSGAEDWEYIGYGDTVAFEEVYSVQRLRVNFATSKRPPADWARDAVGRAYCLRIFRPYDMPGYSSDNRLGAAVPESDFGASINREDFCQMAAALYNELTPYEENPFRGAESSATEKKLPVFTDTTNTDVRKMAYLGVITGVGEGVFDPEGELTREQAATILSRLAGVLKLDLPTGAATFDDSGSVASWAKDAVGQMQKSGIMGGMGNNQFGPQGSYSWEQSIATLMRLYDMAQGK